MNTLGFLAIPAEIVPEQEAVVSEGRRFTYAETLARVRRLASALAHLGVGRGTRVAALHTNSHRYVEAYYAVAMLGAVFIPLNYRAKRPELEHMLRAGGAEVVLVGARYLEHLEALRGGLPELRTIIGLDGPTGCFPGHEDLVAAAVQHPAETEVQDDDVTILMYTSGTTALPKGVMLTFGDFTAYVTANVELADGTPRGAALLSVPLYHIAGATNMMTTLWTGRRLVLMPQFEPRSWLDLVERERITHAFLVPTMLKQLLDQPDLERRDLSSLEILSYGGAAMPFPVIRRAIERFPKSVGFVIAFGQTETTSTLTLLGPAEVEAVLQSHPSVEEAAVVGVPDVEWGQRVAAFVVLRPGESLSPEALTDFCRERLASFKKPEVVHFVAELPKNPMGKILRKDLRAELGAA